MDIITLDGRTIAEDLPDTPAIQVGHAVNSGMGRYRVSHIEHDLIDEGNGLEVQTTVYVFTA